jgi:hypothetical protein
MMIDYADAASGFILISRLGRSQEMTCQKKVQIGPEIEVSHVPSVGLQSRDRHDASKHATRLIERR